jgi:hypothetical protein
MLHLVTGYLLPFIDNSYSIQSVDDVNLDERMFVGSRDGHGSIAVDLVKCRWCVATSQVIAVIRWQLIAMARAGSMHDRAFCRS